MNYQKELIEKAKLLGITINDNLVMNDAAFHTAPQWFTESLIAAGFVIETIVDKPDPVVRKRNRFKP